MKKYWVLAVLFCLPVWGAKSLFAFTKGACRDDAMKFCQGMLLDEDKVKKCLFEHRTEVSDPCKENIKETVEKKKDAKAGGAPKEQSSGY